MPYLSLAAALVMVTFIGALALLIVVWIYQDKIKLEKLIAESDGSASLSRFQFLLFTFVIASSVLVLTIESGSFPAISPEVLGLIGLSGGSYVVSKAIQKSGGKDAGKSATNDAGKDAQQ